MQRLGQVSAKGAHHRRGRTAGSRAGGSRICAERDGRPRDQRSLFWRRAVSAIRAASRRDLSGKRIATAFSVARNSGAAPGWLNSATSYERGLVNGFIRLSGGMMLKGFFLALLCSSILIEKIHAQEVIVAREKKPEPVRQTPESPKQTVLPSEELPSETPTPTPRKSKPRENKAAPATLTLEEMRTAGAHAAEGLNDRSVSQPTKTRQPDVESTPALNPTVAETPRPVKTKTPIEQSSSSLPAKPRSTNLEGIGPIRPTMMESGREPPSPSPSGR